MEIDIFFEENDSFDNNTMDIPIVKNVNAPSMGNGINNGANQSIPRCFNEKFKSKIYGTVYNNPSTISFLKNAFTSYIALCELVSILSFLNSSCATPRIIPE